MRSPKVANVTLACESNGNVGKASNSSKRIEGSVTTSQSSGRDTPTVQKAASHGLPLIRKSLECQSLSASSTDIIMASWRKGTKKQYMSYLMRWEEYCKREHIAPHNPGKVKAIEFLRELYEEWLGYSAINTARSALSSVITPNGGIPFGRDPLVCRFLKGIFELKPCLPKYSKIWDVNNVLCYFKSCSLVGEMDLKDLTMNLATLLCLLTGQLCQTIHKMDMNFIQLEEHRCTITIREVLKHTKVGKHQAPFQFCSYPPDRKICIVEYLREYIKRTSQLKIGYSRFCVSNLLITNVDHIVQILRF